MSISKHIKEHIVLNTPSIRTDASGATVLVGAGGEIIPLGSLLSTTTLKMGTSTVVNTGLEIVFDTTLRDDLGIAITGTGRIQIPASCTQFRLIYDVALTSTIVGAYRKITPIMSVDGSLTGAANIPIRPQTVIPFTTVTAGVNIGMSTCSQLIDTATFLASIGGAFAGNTTDYFSLKLDHDATAGTLSVLAGSTITLETYA